MTLEQLKAQGMEPHVVHLRWSADGRLMSRHEFKEEGIRPEPKGGITVVHILTPWGAFPGAAACSRLDNFSRQTGREIAAFRAWKLAMKWKGSGIHHERELRRASSDGFPPDVHDDPSWGPESAARFGVPSRGSR